MSRNEKKNVEREGTASLLLLARAWELRRERFVLNRRDRSFREIIHELHRW